MKAFITLAIAAGLVGLALLVGLFQNKLNAVPYNNCPIETQDDGYTAYQCRDHVYYVR